MYISGRCALLLHYCCRFHFLLLWTLYRSAKRKLFTNRIGEEPLEKAESRRLIFHFSTLDQIDKCPCTIQNSLIRHNQNRLFSPDSILFLFSCAVDVDLPNHLFPATFDSDFRFASWLRTPATYESSIERGNPSGAIRQKDTTGDPSINIRITKATAPNPPQFCRLRFHRSSPERPGTGREQLLSKEYQILGHDLSARKKTFKLVYHM